MSCKDCEEIPPVSAEYAEKGRYETIAGLKTYVTGPADATRAVIFIYDVFGPVPQTLQGADRLAAHLARASSPSPSPQGGGTVVLVPDFLAGTYVRPEWLPADTPAKQQALAAFRAGAGNIDRAVAALLRVRAEAVTEKWFPAADEHVAAGGLCWGGKVSVLACGAGNEGRGRKFTVNWTAHPGRLDAADAEALTVPYICLASPGEPADVVARIKEIVSTPPRVGYVETYGPPMFHGWMGGRANLADEANAREYERGYKSIADFVAKYI